MEAKNKEKAINFLRLIIEGKIDKAYEKYVDMNGKHHNVFFQGDFHSLKKAMKEAHMQFPNKEFIIKNALEDGEIVAVHSHLVRQSGESTIVVHIFRFHNNK